MNPHPNSEVLMAIAVGKTIERYVKDTDEWVNVSNPLEALVEGHHLRIGESFITINGIKICPPETKPLNRGEIYYIVDIANFKLVESITWSGDSFDLLMLRRGLVHRSPENAENHAIAVISFTGPSK